LIFISGSLTPVRTAQLRERWEYTMKKNYSRNTKVLVLFTTLMFIFATAEELPGTVNEVVRY